MSRRGHLASAVARAGQHYTRSPVIASSIAGLIQWQQAATPGTLAAGKVQSWTDLSGSGNHLLQATAANQPLWTAAGGKGGKPTVKLDGVTQYLKTAPYALATPRTIVLVYRNNNIGSGDIILDGDAAGSTYIQSTAVDFNIASAVDYPFAVANAAYTVVTTIWGTGVSAIRINGTQVATGSFGVSPGGVTLGAFGGGTRSSPIEVTEMAIYNSALSGATLGPFEASLRVQYV